MPAHPRFRRRINRQRSALRRQLTARALLLKHAIKLLLIALSVLVVVLSLTGLGAKAMERGRALTKQMNSLVGQLTTTKKATAAKVTLTAAPPVFATLTVTNLNASGTGSLLAAINGAVSGDTIVFQAGLTGTISPTATYSIAKNLTITGPGAGVISISGSNLRKVFTINSGFAVTISGLTITGGRATSQSGAGITNNSSTLTLNNCTLSSNTSSLQGAAIYNTGTLTLNNCTVTQNSASNNGGGGIYSTGAVTVNGCTFTNNSAPGTSNYGGAIYSPNLTATSSTFSGNTSYGGAAIYIGTTGTITDCVINGNTATNSAGGIFINSTASTVTVSRTQISGNSATSGVGMDISGGIITLDRITVSGNTATSTNGSPNASGIGVYGGTVTLKNSTISGNTGGAKGGGIYHSNGTLNLINDTITSNQTGFENPLFQNGGGIYSQAAGLSLKNTIIAGNTCPNGPDMQCTKGFTSLGNNLIGNNAGIGSGAIASDLQNVNPLLLPLGSYGGTLQTHLIPANSAAINAGSDTTVAPDSLTTDARGALRKVGAAVDIGAVENTITTFSPATLPNGSTSSAYNQTITGGSNFLLGSGTLPPGLTLSTGGILSGTPTTGGAYTFAVKATDVSGYQGAINYTVVINPPTISTQPVSIARCLGAAASFSVTATGTGTLTYQWRKGGVNITGATSSTYTIAAVAATDAGNYEVVVTDANGTVTSTAATLTINANTVITTQPTSLTQCAGTAASFSVAATGANLTYQWRKGGVNIAGATASTYTIASLTTGDTGSYDVVVSGACSSLTSAAATLTVTATTAGTLGNYPVTTVGAGGNTTITPDAAPAGAMSGTIYTATTNTQFQGTLIVNPTTGVVRVTNAGLAGVYSITIKAIPPCGASISKTFNLTVTTPTACAVPYWGAATTTTVGTNPFQTAIGDFNGDGKQDLAITNYGSNNVTILLGNGTGGFTAASGSPLSVGTQPVSVTTGDFNGDGKHDLAVANYGSNNLTMLLGNGSGGFTAAAGSPIAVGDRPYSVIPSDFNGDSRVDLAVINYGTHNATMLLGNGSGGFSAAAGSPVAAGDTPVSVVAGDFNSDGKVDLATTSLTANNLTILLGTGSGGFTPAAGSPIAVGTTPYAMTTGDFNGDGKADLVTANSASNNATILLGNGSGGFTAAAGSPVTVGTTPRAVSTGDFNGDGKQDLATVNAGSTSVIILLGNGSGGFSTFGSPLTAGTYPIALGVGDFNQDGRADLVSVNYSGNSVSVFMGGCNTPPTLTPATGLTQAQGTTLNNVTIATVSDDLTTAGSLTVTAPTVPAGITLTGITNTSGTIKANITVACTVPISTQTIGLRVNDGAQNTDVNLALQVTPGTVITAQPVSFAQCVGAPASFSVTATGTSLTYQWRKGGVNITGATTSTYNIGAVTAGDAGSYDVIVASSCGAAVTSTAATLTIPVVGSLGNYPATTVGTGGSTLVTPDAAPSGASAGTNYFVSTDSRFTGLLTINPATGVVRVTNAGTAGTYTVTVKAFAPCANPTTTTKTFTLTVTTPTNCGNFSFSGAPDVGVYSDPQSVTTGDFNGDGNLDFATANASFANNVSIRLGNGAGGFSSAPDVGVGTRPRSITTGDFNGDGNLDFATANHDSDNVSIRLGNGAGGFSSAPDVAVGYRPYSVTTGDFNGDGKLDFAVANYLFSSTVSIRLGDGAGNFSVAPDVVVGDNPRSVATGDFNGDGKLDLAVANSSTIFYGLVSIRLGNGNGTFSGTTDVAVGNYPYSVATGDFNGDGKLDFATANQQSDTVSIRLGNGLGGFTGTTDVAVGSYPLSVTTGDFNGDGKLDFAAVNNHGTTVSIRLGDGAGNFPGTTDVAVGSYPLSVTTGDFNGDGKLDFAAANSSNNNVSIRLNNCAPTSTAGSALARTQGAGASNATIATVNDAETAKGSLTVTATTVPTGISISNIINTNGTITADVAAECAAAIDANTVVLTVTDGGGATATANLTVIVEASPVQPTLGTYSNKSVPAGGSITVTPSVAPTNISSITASAPGFTGLLTVNPTTGVVSVTNAQVAGTYTVTVRGVNCGNSVTKTFTLTVNNAPACASTNFATATSMPMGDSAWSVATGDFNNDGKLDFVVARQSANKVSVRLGTGSGGFTNAPDVTVGTNPYYIVVGDLNNDGNLDFATANPGNNTVSIRLGNGSGGFTTPATPEVVTSAGMSSITLGDFNGDGKLDFATPHWDANNISIRLGDGGGGFTSPAVPQVAVGTNPGNIVVGDFNGDGKLDFVSNNWGGNSVSVRLGNGLGGFTLPAVPQITLGTNPFAMVAGDFDRDGKLDFAAGNNGDGVVSICRGNGDGSFLAPYTVTTNNNPQHFTLGDFNGDGKLDFATANYFDNKASIRLGDGSGGFPTLVSVTVGANPNSIAAGDFNGDGKLDFITANRGSNNVSLALNSCNTAPTIVTNALTRAQGTTSNVTLATVSDGETAAGALTVTATSVPTGITVSNIVNTNGTITADVTVGCVQLGTQPIELQVSDGTLTATANLNLQVTASTAPPPTITTHPTSQSVAVETTATFTVAGTNADTIQWQTSVNGGHFWTNIPGATSATFSMPVRPSYDGNRYRAVLSNCTAVANSNAAILTVTGSSTNANLTGLVIREFRLRGNATGGVLDPAQDEYIDLYNVTANNLTVNNGGWAVAALSADGNSSTVIATIPNGTVIPSKGHYLLVNPNGYSLGALAAGDATFTANLADDSGLAIFNTTNPVSFGTTTRIDAVGFQSLGSQAALFREGTGLATLGAINAEYAWVRKMQNGQAVDTDNNASDFLLVNTSGNAVNGVSAQLGAPGPANSTGAIEMNSQIIQSPFDLNVATTNTPNQVRDLAPVTNGTFGTLLLRRSYTNNSGARLSKVRFRLIDITNAASGTEADLRLLNSVTATIDGKTVEGLTIETAPTQPNGGGINSLFVIGPDLPIGATLNVEFKLGVMRKGKYRFILNIEASQ